MKGGAVQRERKIDVCDGKKQKSESWESEKRMEAVCLGCWSLFLLLFCLKEKRGKRKNEERQRQRRLHLLKFQVNFYRRNRNEKKTFSSLFLSHCEFKVIWREISPRVHCVNKSMCFFTQITKLIKNKATKRERERERERHGWRDRVGSRVKYY